MGINLVYGFAVPGIDNAGHIGGALTGLLIALPIGLAHQKRLKALHSSGQDSIAPYHTEYVNYQAKTDSDNTINPEESSIYNDTDAQNPVNSYENYYKNNEKNAAIIAQFDNKYAANDFDDNANSTRKSTATALTNPAIIWQLLPWIMMVLIAIGFISWWLTIHNQILQVLAT